MPTVDEARQWYDPADPVHGFDHVVRVMRLAERLARELGADLEIVRAAALLHDASGAAPGAQAGERLRHEHDLAALAAEVLAREGWPLERIEAVMHCIRAHRFRGTESPASLEAQVLFDADKLDVMGAFGAAGRLATPCRPGSPSLLSRPNDFCKPARRSRANRTAPIMSTSSNCAKSATGSSRMRPGAWASGGTPHWRRSSRSWRPKRAARKCSRGSGGGSAGRHPTVRLGRLSTRRGQAHLLG